MNAAATTASFTLIASSVSPLSGSTGGGNILSVNGTGFSTNSQVTVDGLNCQVVSSSYHLITCIVPSSAISSNKQVDVVITDSLYTSSIRGAYLYDFNG